MDQSPDNPAPMHPPAGAAELPPLPVRMLNEFTYCPRLGYLMWVQGEFADTADTVDGRFQHRRVDQDKKRRVSKAGADEGPTTIHARSVSLASERLGLVAKIDLVEGQGNKVAPVDYKRGKRPHVAKGAWEPELIQLCAQGLILRENGYECDGGILYFAASRERVPVEFDAALVARTLELAEQMRTAAREGAVPPPLVDSPKCPRCALVSICLPDEVSFLHDRVGEPRPLFAARDDALPFYVQHQGARVRKDGDVLKILDGDATIDEGRIREMSQLVLFGGVQVSTAVIQDLCRRGLPIAYFSGGGWFYGVTHGMSHKNVELRRHQYRAATDSERSLILARRFVQAKIANCRTLLRRNASGLSEDVLHQLKGDTCRAGEAPDLQTLLGIEGNAAQRYFSQFSGMLTQGLGFEFEHRNRRPPRDPVNALLSLAYAMLAREWTATLLTVGFDPFLGFYHQPRYGRPALALDLMEEFRPLIADSVVLTAINNEEVRQKDFISTLGAVALSESGRKRFIEVYERRMGQEITHPVFGYTISYRRVLEVQARLLGRYLAGEIPEYPSFTTR